MVPQASEAATRTVLVVFTAKQVFEGGGNCRVAFVQQVSIAVAVNGAVVQLLHVYTVMFEHWMERQALEQEVESCQLRMSLSSHCPPVPDVNPAYTCEASPRIEELLRPIV